MITNRGYFLNGWWVTLSNDFEIVTGEGLDAIALMYGIKRDGDMTDEELRQSIRILDRMKEAPTYVDPNQSFGPLFEKAFQGVLDKAVAEGILEKMPSCEGLYSDEAVRKFETAMRTETIRTCSNGKKFVPGVGSNSLSTSQLAFAQTEFTKRVREKAVAARKKENERVVVDRDGDYWNE